MKYYHCSTLPVNYLLAATIPSDKHLTFCGYQCCTLQPASLHHKHQNPDPDSSQRYWTCSHFPVSRANQCQAPAKPGCVGQGEVGGRMSTGWILHSGVQAEPRSGSFNCDSIQPGLTDEPDILIHVKSTVGSAARTWGQNLGLAAQLSACTKFSQARELRSSVNSSVP